MGGGYSVKSIQHLNSKRIFGGITFSEKMKMVRLRKCWVGKTKKFIMAQSIFSLICVSLICTSATVFAIFVISTLNKVNTKIDNIPNPKHHWSIGIYMDNIPQNEQNTAYLNSVPLKIYESGEYSDLLIPCVGEEVGGVYYSDKDKFEMKGIVTRVFYNTDMDWIAVSCKCTEIRKVY